MANQFLKLRRSAVPGRIPSTSSLDFGEIALNTYDGLAFIKKSGSAGEEIVAIGANTTAITGSANFVPLFNGSSSLVTSSIYQSGSFTAIGSTAPPDPNNPEGLLVNVVGGNSYNLISGHTNVDNYAQLNVQNFNNGIDASSDIVATADDGTEEDGYINMGINSSGFQRVNSIGGPRDGYLYSAGNDFYIGNVTPNQQFVLFNGGPDVVANAKIWIHGHGTVGINTDQFDAANPPSMQIEAPNDTTYNLVLAKGNVNNFSQIGVSNSNSGSNASADLALYNNIDPEGQAAGFIDIGINSTNYVYNGIYPGTAGDGYVFTDSHHLVLGATSGSGNTKVTIFAGGISEFENAKLILFGNNQHQMTGSLSITGGITGSLYGTSSWAQNAITASYVAASNVVGLSLFQIATGSITASVGLNNDLFLIKSGSKTYFNISSSGDTTIYSSNFMIRDFNTNEMVFQVSASRAYFDFDGITIATQSVAPTGSADVGGILFTSTAMYIGLE